MPDAAEEAETLRAIATHVERIRAVLAGKPPTLQGAILADCVAIWLAGHNIAGDSEATQQLRADLLAMHVRIVRDLIPINVRIYGIPP